MLMSRHLGQPSVSPCLSKSLRERYMALRPLVLWPTRSASSGLSSGNALISASYSSTRRAPLSHEVHIRVLIGGVGVLTGLGPWLARIGCLDLKPPKYVSNTSNTLLDVTTRIGSHAAMDISDDIAGWCLCGRDDVACGCDGGRCCCWCWLGNAGWLATQSGPTTHKREHQQNKKNNILSVLTDVCQLPYRR